MNREFLAELAARAESADRNREWPAASLEAVRAAGAFRWSIPRRFGGEERDAVELLDAHERIGTACLTAAFILSQREAAIRQIAKGPAQLQERFLPDLAAGSYATVGLSQLTTSRLHRGPSLRATPTDAGYRLDGELPWVTGADQASAIVVGAALEDGLQVLVAVPSDRSGLRIAPPLPLVSLVGSRTASITFEGVLVERELVVVPPTARAVGPIAGGGLDTSNLALALSVAAAHFIEEEAASRPDLEVAVDRLRSETDALRNRLHTLAVAPDPDAVLVARVDGTRLALRATQAALLAAKGAGFVEPHPAGRFARQALFFLVWSCPRPVAVGLLDDFLARE